MKIKTKEKYIKNKVKAKNQAINIQSTLQKQYKEIYKEKSKSTSNFATDTSVENLKTATDVSQKLAKSYFNKTENTQRKYIYSKAIKQITPIDNLKAHTAVSTTKHSRKKNIGKALKANVKAIISAANNTSTALLAGGFVSVIVIVIIMLIAFIATSPIGVLFSANVQGDVTLQKVMQQIDQEFKEQVKEIAEAKNYARVEYVSNTDSFSISWQEVLPIYAVKASEEYHETVTITGKKIELLKQILKDMVKIETEQKTELTSVENTEINPETGKPITKTEYEESTVLAVKLTHKMAINICEEYGFNDSKRNKSICYWTIFIK